MLEELSQALFAPQHGCEEPADQEKELHSKPMNKIKHIPVYLRILVDILRNSRNRQRYERHKPVDYDSHQHCAGT